MDLEIFDSFIDCVIVTDEDGSVLYANNSARETFGIRNSDVRKNKNMNVFLQGESDFKKHIVNCSAKWKELNVKLKNQETSRKFRILAQHLHTDKIKKKIILINDSNIENKLQHFFMKEKKLKERSIEETEKYKSGLELFAFTILFAVTGFTFLALKYAVAAFPPFFLEGVRFGLGGLTLLIVLLANGKIKLSLKDFLRDWKHVLVFRVVGYGGLAYSLRFIPSGMAAAVLGTIPLVLACFELFSGRIVSSKKLFLGIFLGLISTFVIAWDSFESVTEVGGLLVLGIVMFAWCFGAITLGRKRDLYQLPYNYLFSGIVLLGISYFGENWSTIDITNAPSSAILGFLYLFVFLTLITDPAMTWLMGQVSATKASIFIYVKPVVAILVGALIAGEPFTFGIFISLFVMVYSVRLVLSDKHEQKGKNYIDSGITNNDPKDSTKVA